jgi:hypothetical protein
MRAETRLQRHLRTMFHLRGYRTVAVPNGATLRGDSRERAIQMANLKRDGLCVGFSDLLVYGSHGRIGHVEVKTPEGKQSDNQRACEEWLTDLGHLYAVARSVDDVDAILSKWGWE